MAKTPKRLQQKSWDAINARYASLDNPEWVIWSRLPAYFWDDEQNHKRCTKWLAKEPKPYSETFALHDTK